MNKRKLEKIEELVQGTYGISYSEFRNNGKIQLPEFSFASTVQKIEGIEIKAELIIVGFDQNGFGLLVQSDEKCSVSIKEDFACVGEGAFLAQASLLNRLHSNIADFGRSLCAVYEAKKFSEGVPSVGKNTSISIIDNHGNHEIMTADGDKFLKDRHEEMERKKSHITEKVPIKEEFFHSMSKKPA